MGCRKLLQDTEIDPKRTEKLPYWSALGDGTLAICDATGVTLEDARSGALIKHLTGGSCFGGAFSPDGRVVAAWALFEVDLVDAQSGAVLARLPEAAVGALAFAPDSRLLAVGDLNSGRHPLVERAGRRARVGSFTDEGERLTPIAFSPDGRRLIAGGIDGALRLWDLASHRKLASLIAFKRRLVDQR